MLRGLKASGGLIVLLLCIAGGAQATPLTASDVDGHKVTLLQDRSRRATVLLFVTNECPITNSYAPEIQRLYLAYTARRIAFYLVYADSDLKPAAVRQHLRDYRLSCPALLDPGHRLVHFTQAAVTPEAVVLSPTGARLYQGRIDDRYLDFGKARFAATAHDLRDALDAVLQGRPIAHPTTRAIGCYISAVPSQ